MNDLQRIIQEHPDCLSNRNRFKSFLQDIYPTEKRFVNLLVILVECGIVEKIGKLSCLDDKGLYLFVQQLENEYGISAKYSQEAICQWANACNIPINVTHIKITNEVTNTLNTMDCHTSSERQPIIGDAGSAINNVNSSADNSDDFLVIQKDGRFYIRKYTGFDEDTIIVPSCIDGKKVYGIYAEVFKSSLAMKKLIIEDGIQEIGAGAFEECKSLQSISIPNSVTKICQRAFSKCGKLKSVVIPDSVTVIENEAFSYCTNLISIKFPESLDTITKNVCFGCSALIVLLLPSKLATIERYAFKSCDMLREIRIPEGTKKIEIEAFAGCKRLEKAYIPSTAILEEIDFANHPAHPFKTAFENTEPTKLVIVCEKGSAAMRFAKAHGIMCVRA